MQHSADKIMVLHVLGGLNRGGAESWLVQMMRSIDRSRYQMDFLVHTTELCAYDDEIKALGGKIIPCLHPSRPWIYAKNLRKALIENGPYDIVHSHVHHFSGLVLKVARQAGVPVRIAHSHNDRSSAETGSSAIRRAYLGLMKSWIVKNATHGLAVSDVAGKDLFDGSWDLDGRWEKMLLGIDLRPFGEKVDRAEIRAEFGLSKDIFIVGHVGRFAVQKNHAFLLDIASETIKRDPQVRFLLVGDGLLRAEMEKKAAALGLEKKVVFTGLRSDAPRLMLGAMDAFILPSLHEGLPLVLMEAQAAGLPCILSDVIAEESDFVKPLMHRLSLSQPASEWAESILEIKKSPRIVTRSEALAEVGRCPVNIARSIARLEAVYAGRLSSD